MEELQAVLTQLLRSKRSAAQQRERQALARAQEDVGAGVGQLEVRLARGLDEMASTCFQELERFGGKVRQAARSASVAGGT